MCLLWGPGAKALLGESGGAGGILSKSVMYSTFRPGRRGGGLCPQPSIVKSLLAVIRRQRVTQSSVIAQKSECEFSVLYNVVLRHNCAKTIYRSQYVGPVKRGADNYHRPAVYVSFRLLYMAAI